LKGASIGESNWSGSNFGVTEIKDSEGNSTGRSWPANLMNADFTGSNLERSNLSRANLESANFSNCRLIETDLTGATTGDTSFEGAEINPAAIPH